MTDFRPQKWHAFAVALLLVPPWMALGVACYWVFFDDKPPLELTYQHPEFLSHEALSRSEARQYEIKEADSGEWVWIYREMCVTKQIVGSSQGAWLAASFLWQTSERTIPPLELGCYARAFNIRVPTTNPSRDFIYRTTWAWENNPLVTTHIQMPDIPIRVRKTGDTLPQDRLRE